MSELQPIAARVAARLVERGETIAVAVSAAGGLIAAALLMVPGASRFFLGGAVLYTVAARQALLGIGPHGWDSPRHRTLCAACRAPLPRAEGATWALAETGAAGPAGNRYGDSAGHACFAVSGPHEEVRTSRRARPTVPPTCAPSPLAHSNCSPVCF
jgi:nicotinamide-nucleotide amidase